MTIEPRIVAQPPTAQEPACGAVAAHRPPATQMHRAPLSRPAAPPGDAAAGDAAFMAGVFLSPESRHALIAAASAPPGLPEIDINGIADAVGVALDAAAAGDLTLASRTLTAQALSLDVMFAQFAERAVTLAATHPDAAERMMRLALKAQGNSRTAWEAVANLHRPRDTVRLVAVADGGQAIVADAVHHHHGHPPRHGE